MGTSNPTMNPAVFQHATAETSYGDQSMTIQGTSSKTMILLGILTVTAAWVWSQLFQSAAYGLESAINISLAKGYMLGGGLGGFVLALVLTFKPNLATYLAPAYAVLEGLFIGAITSYAEASFPGLPMQAALLTFCVLAAMLGAYRSGVVRPTDRFKSIMTAAMGGIFLVYLVSMILGFFGVQIPYIHGSGPIGIAFSLIVVGIAAFSLVLDFEMIEQGAKTGAPKYMEWYGAFALLVTLVWLYLEILKLLMKLSRRDD